MGISKSIFLLLFYAVAGAQLIAEDIGELRKKEKYSQALKLVDLEKNPLLAARLYLDLDQFHKAIGLYQKSCQSENLRCQNEWGIALMAIGKYGQAKRHFINALALAGRRGDLHSNLALSYLYLGDSEKSAKHYQLALQFAPRDKNIRLNYAAWLLKQKRIPKARAMLQGLVDEGEPLFLAHLYLGLSYLYSNDYEKAHDEFSKGIQINRYYFDLYLHRAKVRYKLGAKRGALIDLDMAQKIKPNNIKVMPLKALISE